MCAIASVTYSTGKTIIKIYLFHRNSQMQFEKI